MLRLLLILSPLVFVPMLLPAVPAAPVPREANKPVYYFPTEVGAKWVYRNDGTRDATGKTVLASEERGGRVLVTIKATAPDFVDDDLTAIFQYELSKDGIFLVASQYGPEGPFEKCDPPVCILKLPHKDGNTWEMKSNMPWERKHVATKIETVTVPAGTFQAIRVESGDKRVTWYALGHGVVKQYNWGTLTEMKSFELPKK